MGAKVVAFCLCLLLILGCVASAYAGEDSRLDGTISKVGCVFDADGVRAILVNLTEHPKLTFEIPPDYGKQMGFKKVLDIWEKQGMRATSGVMGAWYEDTGLEGRKVSVLCSESQSEQCPVKSLKWRE